MSDFHILQGKLELVTLMMIFFVIFFASVSGGELFERVVAEDNLTESEAAMFIKQILQGLHHMHEKNIIHLDLKVEICVFAFSFSVCLILTWLF